MKIITTSKEEISQERLQKGDYILIHDKQYIIKNRIFELDSYSGNIRNTHFIVKEVKRDLK